jgi:tetratricopeptide (TPR) repeat protein
MRNDPGRDDALAMRIQAQREIATRAMAQGRECEQQDKFGAALLQYREAQKLNPELEGIVDDIARMEKEVQAGLLVEKAQKEMRKGNFDRARNLLDEAFEMAVMSRPQISEAMIETRRLEAESRYQAARDLEVLGKKGEALAGYEALSKDWPDGFSDEKARIEGLKYDVENAQKEWDEAEAAEAANDLPKALEHYKNSERFYAGMKDGAARIERLQAAIRAAGGTSGGSSGGTSGGD